MEKRKKRIEAFIANHKEAKLKSGAFVIGGKSKAPDSIMAAENGGNCTNSTFLTCNESTNSGSCRNGKDLCNNTKNGKDCKNDIVFVNADTTC